MPVNTIQLLEENLREKLREKGISPTAQRVEIARLLFTRHEHLSADEVHQLVNKDLPAVSKATVYNTLGLFVEHGLIRQVIADPSRVYYDPNTAPHHHVYDVATGQLTDICLEEVQVKGLPAMSPGVQLEGVDVIVRVRSERPVSG